MVGRFIIAVGSIMTQHAILLAVFCATGSCAGMILEGAQHNRGGEK